MSNVRTWMCSKGWSNWHLEDKINRVKKATFGTNFVLHTRFGRRWHRLLAEIITLVVGCPYRFAACDCVVHWYNYHPTQDGTRTCHRSRQTIHSFQGSKCRTLLQDLDDDDTAFLQKLSSSSSVVPIDSPHVIVLSTGTTIILRKMGPVHTIVLAKQFTHRKLLSLKEKGISCTRSACLYSYLPVGTYRSSYFYL